MAAWIGLSLFIALALAVDLSRASAEGVSSVRVSLIWSVIWTMIGLGFAGLLALVDGGQGATEYLAGFLIERSLSLDNLFVFAMLFTFFAVPHEQRERVLVLGIIGAVVLRGIFIAVGAAALETFSWTTYLFGALLLLTAVKIARQGDAEIEPDKTPAMRALRRIVPVSDKYDGNRLFTRVGSRRSATPLLAALVMVAAFDLMFAIDSIPAIFAITQDTFIVFAANAFSLLGMTSLYFLLDRMLERFRYLNVALALILGYVAAKMLLIDLWHPPVVLSLAVVIVTLAVAAATSVVVSRLKDRAGDS